MFDRIQFYVCLLHAMQQDSNINNIIGIMVYQSHPWAICYWNSFIML